MMLNIVLVEPEIPGNTGNIARTCAITGARLHLIEPLGFSIKKKEVRRAGLDYWDKLNVATYANTDDFFAKNEGASCYYFSTKAKQFYTEVQYDENAFLLFGKETAGLPESLIFSNMERAVRIPMRGELRSLNLANSVAVAAYEVLRQQDFAGLT
ncbi:MAG: tRNA (cytidine(34)-2'-O)-methyltransferase [Christensenellaceae bacterium]